MTEKIIRITKKKKSRSETHACTHARTVSLKQTLEINQTDVSRVWALDAEGEDTTDAPPNSTLTQPISRVFHREPCTVYAPTPSNQLKQR